MIPGDDFAHEVDYEEEFESEEIAADAFGVKSLPASFLAFLCFFCHNY